MIKVIGVRFRTAGKIYFFDPLALDIKKGDNVIVETARGIEFGTVVSAPKEIEDDKVPIASAFSCFLLLLANASVTLRSAKYFINSCRGVSSIVYISFSSTFSIWPGCSA